MDITYSIEDTENTLTKIAHNILHSTLDITTTEDTRLIKKMDSLAGRQLRNASVRRIERIVKLEKRGKQLGKGLDKDDMKTLNGMKLWLSTTTRIYLFAVENALNTTEINIMAEYIWTYLLVVPLLPQYISSMILNHLRTWTLGAIYHLIKEKNVQQSPSSTIGGNGYLFITANLVDLYHEKIINHEERIITFQLMEMVKQLVSMISPYFSERQHLSFTNYHPLFKWSSCSWGNTIDSTVFELILQNQIAILWSKSFMDQLFEPILKFQPLPTSPSISNNNKSSPSTAALKIFSGKKRNATAATNENDSSKNFIIKNNNNNINHTNMAEFSMDIQIIFSMYSQLGHLFTQQRKIILARIAFTPKLISQLWLVMNHFGPEGNMLIYLKAAKKNILEVEKEPLIDVLKIFCEACSLVFLTLDDIDIFQNEKPFTVSHLLNLGQFLNNFYFSLIRQSSQVLESTVEFNSDQIKSSTIQQESKQKHLVEQYKTILHSFQATRRLLLQIHDLDTRHPFCPSGHWLLISDPLLSKQTFLRFLFNSSKDHRTEASQFLTQLRQGDLVSTRILQSMPHTIPFDTRLHIFRDWIQLDKSSIIKRPTNVIRIRRQFILEDGLKALGHISSESWKSGFQVSFVNELGVVEAGIDQGGPFKDFVTMLIAEVFKPSYSLFSHTANTNFFYPSNTSSIHGPNHIQLFEFIGKMIGKAVYEGILLDCQFARFFLAKLLGRNIFLEALQELDEDIWKNLIFLKHYEGNAEDLGLTFSTDEEVFGQIKTKELKYRGQHIDVTNENKLEYVYLMADYKLNQQAWEQTKAFLNGFRSIISADWVKVFSPPELQRVISGEDKDFDIPDLRKHTQYQNGYFDQHPIIKMLWQIIQEFKSDDKRAFLKFVTSCPKPPLGGFDFLQPPFTIRMVSLNDQSLDGIGLVKSMLKFNSNNEKSGRLPTSSTCFNLLKLPAYTKKSVLREKLLYAIHSNTGFELS
ncbi:hypothetical protein BJ944DRAFT_290241, partial [Cunninghamella echinulata]